MRSQCPSTIVSPEIVHLERDKDIGETFNCVKNGVLRTERREILATEGGIEEGIHTLKGTSDTVSFLEMCVTDSSTFE